MSIQARPLRLLFSLLVGLAATGCDRDLVIDQGESDRVDEDIIEPTPATSGTSQASSSASGTSASSSGGGVCADAASEAACDDGDACTDRDACDDGSCVGQPVRCDEPASPSCVDQSTFRTFGAGRCNEGECVYDATDATCPLGCEHGVCKRPPTIVAGFTHTCAVSEEGRLRCWGTNHHGQLGYGHTDTIGDDETPASAGDVDVGGVVTQVSLGEYHTCAVLETGALRCWGSGDIGLGYGTPNDIGDDETPAEAGDIDLGEPVAEVAAGMFHTCARLISGAVRCWGTTAGIAGNGTVADIGDDEPAIEGDVVELGGPAQALSSTHLSSCALVSGFVRCWGYGGHGQLGYATMEDVIGDDETVASMGDVALGSSTTQLAGGGSHVCALDDQGALRCWGFGQYGALGYGNTQDIGDDEQPATAGVVDAGDLVAQISAGASHTCALLVSGSVRCWGDSPGAGLLGPGFVRIGDDEVPSSVGTVPFGDATRVVALTSGGAHACVRLVTGAFRCWGYNLYGQLGYGDTTSRMPNDLVDIDVW